MQHVLLKALNGDVLTYGNKGYYYINLFVYVTNDLILASALPIKVVVDDKCLLIFSQLTRSLDLVNSILVYYLLDSRIRARDSYVIKYVNDTAFYTTYNEEDTKGLLLSRRYLLRDRVVDESYKDGNTLIYKLISILIEDVIRLLYALVR